MIDFSNIMKLEYVENIGECSYQRIALYNKEAISRQKVIHLIKKGKVHSSKYAVVLTRDQFETLFGSQIK